MSRRALARAYMDVPTGLFVATAAATTAAAASIYYSMAQLTQANEGIQQLRESYKTDQEKTAEAAKQFSGALLNLMGNIKEEFVKLRPTKPVASARFAEMPPDRDLFVSNSGAAKPYSLAPPSRFSLKNEGADLRDAMQRFDTDISRSNNASSDLSTKDFSTVPQQQRVGGGESSSSQSRASASQ